MEYVDVGPDRFNALLMTEACRSDGLEGELLTASGVDPWSGSAPPAVDPLKSKQAVARIVERTAPGEGPLTSVISARVAWDRVS